MYKYINKILIIIIFIFLFVLSSQTIYAKEYGMDYIPYINLKNFTYTPDINKLIEAVKIDSDKLKEYKDNYSPSYETIYIPTALHRWDMDKLTNNIGSKIYGRLYVSDNLKKIIQASLTQNFKDPAEKAFLLTYSTLLKNTNTIDLNLLTASKLLKYSQLQQTAANLVNIFKSNSITTDTSTFFAGITSNKTLNKVFSNYDDILKNLNTYDELKSAKNNALGACFKINPTGDNKYNRCMTTIAKNCPTSKDYYFNYGISCEDLNTLIKDTDHKAKIETDLNKLNDTTVATTVNRDKTLFKPQVAFGDIKEGINFGEYISALYKYLIMFTAILTGLMLVLGGLKYMKDPQSGKALINNSLIGFVLLLSSYSILKFINPNLLYLKNPDITDIQQNTYGITTTAYDNNINIIQNPDNAKLHKMYDLTDPIIAKQYNDNTTITVKDDWCFPLAQNDIQTNNEKPVFPHSLHYKQGGSFGDNRAKSVVYRNNKYYLHCHAGIDLFSKYKYNSSDSERDGLGTVIAITDGKIRNITYGFTRCGPNKEFSVIAILVDHGDFQARYCELNQDDPISKQLKVGSEITKGQILGRATDCGMLHFELYPKTSVFSGTAAWFNFTPSKDEITETEFKKYLDPNYNSNTYGVYNCLQAKKLRDYKGAQLMDSTNLLLQLYNNAYKNIKNNQEYNCGIISNDTDTTNINLKKYSLKDDIKKWFKEHPEYRTVFFDSISNDYRFSNQ